MSYEEVFNEANPKVKLLLYFLKQGYKLDDILEIKVKDITPKGVNIHGRIVEIPGDIVKILGSYVYSNQKHIKTFLFPGRTEEKLTKINALISIRNACKKSGVKLSDLGLGLSMPSKGKHESILNKPDLTLEEIYSFLNKELKAAN